MRISWDEPKRQKVLRDKGIDFAHMTELLYMPYIEDQRNGDPEQYRIVGFAESRLVTFIVEYRYDEYGEYIWVVTGWHSTQSERKAYGQATR